MGFAPPRDPAKSHSRKTATARSKEEDVLLFKARVRSLKTRLSNAESDARRLHSHKQASNADMLEKLISTDPQVVSLNREIRSLERKISELSAPVTAKPGEKKQ